MGEVRGRAFRGMMPIMPTAIDRSGEIDETSQRRLVRYCVEEGAVAVGHFGFASEFFKLSDDDRKRLVGIIVDEVAGRVPVFIGVTAPSDRTAAGYAKDAQSMGADYIMAALPYVRVPRRDEVRGFFGRICAATDLPVIIQDTPQSAALLDVETLISLAGEFATLTHVKAEGTDFLEKSAALINEAGDRLQVIGGAGGKHMIHLLRIGVTAFMTGTEALGLHGAAVKAYLDGDEELAAKIYFERILPYFVFYNDHSDELLKAMLHSRGVIDDPSVISPMGVAPLGEVERREFLWVLDRIGWDRPSTNFLQFPFDSTK